MRGSRMAIRVLITDDHGVVRQGLRMFLSLDPEIEIVGEATTVRRRWPSPGRSSLTWS